MTLKDIFPGLSRTLSFNFQDLPGPKWFSRTFQVMEFARKNPGLSRRCGNQNTGSSLSRDWDARLNEAAAGSQHTFTSEWWMMSVVRRTHCWLMCWLTDSKSTKTDKQHQQQTHSDAKVRSLTPVQLLQVIHVQVCCLLAILVAYCRILNAAVYIKRGAKASDRRR